MKKVVDDPYIWQVENSLTNEFCDKLVKRFEEDPENRKYRGKGILVFNPSEPTASKYCTIQDLEADLAIAQEAMSSDMEEMFHKVIKFVEKESNSGLALVAFYEEDHLELMRLDPEHANEVIDSATNGLIL